MNIRQKIRKFINQIKQKFVTQQNAKSDKTKNKKASTQPQIIFPPARNIPPRTSTHYAYDVYPSKGNDIAPKTQRGFVGRPEIQRKAHDKKRAQQPTEHQDTIAAPVATAKAKAPRNLHRQVVDKAALAEYFDNDPKTKSQQWLDMVVNELDAADKAKKDAQIAARDALRDQYEKLTVARTTDWYAYFKYICHNQKMRASEYLYITRQISKLTSTDPDSDTYKAQMQKYLKAQSVEEAAEAKKVIDMITASYIDDDFIRNLQTPNMDDIAYTLGTQILCHNRKLIRTIKAKQQTK